MDAFMAEAWNEDASKTVNDALVEKVAVIGENLKIRRFEKVVAEHGCVVSYVHGGGRIGVIVDADTDVVNDAVKEAMVNIAMQIAALNPKYVSRDEVSADYIAHEKEILLAQIMNDPKESQKPEKVINVGVSGPGVVYHALQSVKGQPFDVVAETVKKTAFRITRMGQLVAQEASRRLNTPFGIVDLSLAPTPAVGDSVARILEEMGLEVCGTHGTTAALALLNDAVKKGGVMASSSVGGLSGAFIPVSEDEGMIAAASSGALTLDKLEAMTCVCSVGLDMIAVPGDTSAETIAAIIADEAAIGMVNTKTTAVRIIPAPGCKVGDTVEFGGLLGSAPVQAVHPYSSVDFIARGGRIPAPLHSLKN